MCRYNSRTNVSQYEDPFSSASSLTEGASSSSHSTSTATAGTGGEGYSSDYGAEGYTSEYGGAQGLGVDANQSVWSEYYDEAGNRYW
jgi:hypothetical protein